jgi:two-component system chemotaxis sensor kinase CheA
MLAVIDGMLVAVAGRRYVIPTLSIVCTVQREGRDVVALLDGGRTIDLGGRFIPVFSLEHALEAPGSRPRWSPRPDARYLVMVVEHGVERFGLILDQLLGQQQIVIKSLGQSIDAPGITGGAILPDGTVGLVLELGGVLALGREAYEGRETERADAA